MKIVVASANPVKQNAVRSAFEAWFKGESLDIEGIDVRSGVADQPSTDEETYLGAVNRTRHARELVDDADYWVGLEGGVERSHDTLLAFAWVAVRKKGGRRGAARTVTLPLPAAVAALVDDGVELGDANDRVFETVNSKQAGGAFGLLTDGRYTRESVYQEAVTMALLPVAHPLYG